MLIVELNKDEKILIHLKAVPPAKQITAVEGKDFLELKLGRNNTVALLITKIKRQFPQVFDKNTSLVILI